MRVSKAARRYAAAVLGLAQEQQASERLFADMAGLERLADETPPSPTFSATT